MPRIHEDGEIPSSSDEEGQLNGSKNNDKVASFARKLKSKLVPEADKVSSSSSSSGEEDEGMGSDTGDVEAVDPFESVMKRSLGTLLHVIHDSCIDIC